MYHKMIKFTTLYLNKKRDNVVYGTRVSGKLQETEPSFCWNRGCRSSINYYSGLAEFLKTPDL